MAPKKAANGYQLPKPLSKGDILTDSMKKKWIVGPVIGRGGFGEIYCAADADNAPSKVLAYGFVIKLEPHENGPLYVEKNFYLRVAKKEDIAEWVKQKKLSSFGLNPLLGSGCHNIKNIKHRFVVMERYGQDLWTIFLEHHRVFPLPVVLRVGMQVLDVLEYIHSKDYVHADIKGANLLLGFRKGTEGQVFVVDFGLASRYSTTNEYKRDPRKAHNGTIEYTSRDAHMGVPTRRGDLEILAYNMVQWLVSKLPWESLKNPTAVEEAKIKALNNVPEFLKTCFGRKAIPDSISKFVTYVANMEFNEAPDYVKIRNSFCAGLKACGGKRDGPFVFTSPSTNGEENAVPVNGEGRKSTSTPRGSTHESTRGRGRPPKKLDADSASKPARKPVGGRARKRESQETSPVRTMDDIDDIPEQKKSKPADDDVPSQSSCGRKVKTINYHEESNDDSSPRASATKAKNATKTKNISNESSVLRTRHPNFFMQAGVYQRQTK